MCFNILQARFCVRGWERFSGGYGKVGWMKVYRSNLSKLPGRSYNDVERTARKLHRAIERRTKRTPYVKSVYFQNQKVFLNVFWTHLNQKPRADRKRRLKLYALAIDLIENSRVVPLTKDNPNGKNERVHRMAGVSKENEVFYVQIKEDAKGRKYFMSVFLPK